MPLEGMATDIGDPLHAIEEPQQAGPHRASLHKASH